MFVYTRIHIYTSVPLFARELTCGGERNVYVCVYIYIYVCIHTHTDTDTPTHTDTHTDTHTTHAHTHTHTSVALFAREKCEGRRNRITSSWVNRLLAALLGVGIDPVAWSLQFEMGICVYSSVGVCAGGGGGCR